MSELKICRGCHLELPLAAFSFADKRGHLKARCKACENARVRRYYATNAAYRVRTRERSKVWNKANKRDSLYQRKSLLRQKYGLTQEEFARLLASQNNGCALCGNKHHGRIGADGRWKNFMVDHCHETGKVRGLLCHKCNVRLGAYEGLKKDIGLARVVEYIVSESPVIAPAPEPIVPRRYVEKLPPIRHKLYDGPCVVEGCGVHAKTKRLCAKHYARLLRDGEPGEAENRPHRSRRGEDHEKTRFTEQDVRDIRESAERLSDLARHYGVTRSAIWSVKNRLTWKHIT